MTNTRIAWITDEDLELFLNPKYEAVELTLVFKNPAMNEKNKMVVFYNSDNQTPFSSFEDGVNFERKRIEDTINKSSLPEITKKLLVSKLKPEG